MDSEPPQGGSVLPYRFTEPSDGPPHQHDFNYVGGEHTVRFCTDCNKSWALVELQSLIDHSTIYVWRETKEEDEV